METILSETEEKNLIGLLYNHVSFGTTQQVFGEVSEDNARIETARTTLEKLLLKYKLIDSLSPENLLMLGMTQYLDKTVLENFSKNESNKHLQLRAQFFQKT